MNVVDNKDEYTHESEFQLSPIIAVKRGFYNMKDMNSIEQRIEAIESELKSIKHSIESTKVSTDIDTKINQYLNNKYFIQRGGYFEECLYKKTDNGCKYLDSYYIKRFKNDKELVEYYITKTYSIPNPIIVTISINNQTYYDYIH